MRIQSAARIRLSLTTFSIFPSLVASRLDSLWCIRRLRIILLVMGDILEERHAATCSYISAHIISRAKVPENLCSFVGAYRYTLASLEISVVMRLRPQTRAPHNQRKITSQDTTTCFTCVYNV
jgi:hypothetical protein